MTTTSQFLFLADAEYFLKSRGFHLIPDSWDWTNAAGDDAGDLRPLWARGDGVARRDQLGRRAVSAILTISRLR
jgi:hypothetical protein